MKTTAAYPQNTPDPERPMDFVRLTKLAAVENPDCKPGDWSTYQLGSPNQSGQSLPLEYCIEGWLIRRPSVGGRVEILRYSRNNVKGPGYFVSSEVTAVSSDGFHTRNSIYSITVIPAT